MYRHWRVLLKKLKEKTTNPYNRDHKLLNKYKKAASVIVIATVKENIIFNGRIQH